jgi:hypothetical protein
MTITAEDPRLADLRAKGFTITDDGALLVSTGASCFPNGDPQAGAGIAFDWGTAAMPTDEPFPATDPVPRDNIRAQLLVSAPEVELTPGRHPRHRAPPRAGRAHARPVGLEHRHGV